METEKFIEELKDMLFDECPYYSRDNAKYFETSRVSFLVSDGKKIQRSWLSTHEAIEGNGATPKNCLKSILKNLKLQYEIDKREIESLIARLEN